MKGCSLFLLLSILLPPAVAKSDLSQPCFNGVCSSDVDQSPTSMGGTVVLSGSVNAISDITPIAGWEVLNCSSSAAPQTIRLVCTGDSTSCNHLFSNGAENTIVRLPLNCGSGPFAVVAKAAVSSDQSVPHNLSTRSIKRAANTPQVQDLSIHTNFSSITNSAHGEVAFAVVGTNIPGALQNITVAPNMDVNKTIGIFQALSFGPFNIDQEAALDPVSFQNTLTIVNEVLDCDSPEGFLEVSASVDCSIEASLGIVASGTIFPPVLNQFALSTTLEASFQGDVTADASALGSFDSGQVTLTSLPIPGFEIAGIIDITPSLDMDARVVATLDIAADIGYSLPLNLQRIELVLPTSQGSSEASISAGPLEFEIISFPDTPADTSLKFDLIPTLNVDVLVLGLSTTPTNLFLNFDTGVTMDLDLEGSGFDGCVNVGVEVGSTVGVSGPFATLLGFGSGGTGTLFQASKPNLFQQCLPATSRSKRSNDSMELMTSDKSLIKRDLSCLPPDRSLPELLASATVVVF